MQLKPGASWRRSHRAAYALYTETEIRCEWMWSVEMNQTTSCSEAMHKYGNAAGTEFTQL